MDTIEFIRFLSISSVVAPLIIYVQKFSEIPKQSHIIGALLIVCGLFDVLLLVPDFSVPILSNIQDVIQFVLVTWFYYQLVYNKRSDLVMLTSIGAYAAVLIASMFYDGMHSNYTILWTVGSSIITIHAIVYTFNIPRMVIERYFDTNFFSNLIFNASLLSYFSMTVIMFFLAQNVFSSESNNTIDAFWSIHNVFNILKNVGLALGFYYTGKRKIYMTVQQLEKIAQRLEEETGIKT